MQLTNTTADIDFTQIVAMELAILGDPDAPDGSDLPTTGLESPSEGAVDLSVSLLDIFCPGEEDVFNIAETETFAQVTGDGAFSFSDSLAATNAQAIDNLL